MRLIGEWPPPQSTSPSIPPYDALKPESDCSGPLSLSPHLCTGAHQRYNPPFRLAASSNATCDVDTFRFCFYKRGIVCDCVLSSSILLIPPHRLPPPPTATSSQQVLIASFVKSTLNLHPSHRLALDQLLYSEESTHTTLRRAPSVSDTVSSILPFLFLAPQGLVRRETISLFPRSFRIPSLPLRETPDARREKRNGEGNALRQTLLLLDFIWSFG
ncbi:hypothetical protein BDN70DRAFT_380921 [Pholiota conissans]|uniref:Uncharacterized protein n=1 Tax=Pholiota conissans TaxID=109636 RepID=A0A9P5ZA02_9AGAR|nr:hypothetical protein BDN70DRAFT_380921 [Pholiota conissans]